MDVDDTYPSAKRRRTSSNGSVSSRSSSRQRNRNLATRRTDTYSRSRTHSASRSRSQDRTRRSPSSPSEYSPRSRSGSRSYSPISRSVSPLPAQPPHEPDGPPRKTLNYLPLHTISRAHARGITSAKFSPDGALLATASADATINIYSIPQQPKAQDSDSTNNDFKLLRTLRAHLAGVNALAWSPLYTTGQSYTLASASDDKSILLWSPLSSDFPVSPSPLTGHSNYVFSLAFSPKGNMLVSGSHDEAVFLWNVRSGTVMRELPAHSDPVGGVDFVGDGSMVCSCSTDGLIRIWDSGTGQCLRTLVDEDRKGVTGVRFVPNGRYVLGWSLDGAVRLWRVGEGRCVKTYAGHKAGEFGVGGAISKYLVRDGEEACVLSGSEDGGVFAWDVVSKEVLWKVYAHKDVVLGVDWVWGKDGRGLVVSVGRDRDIRVWIEDVDEEVLERRTERLKMEEGVSGYALEDDADEQMMQMEHDANQQLDGAQDVKMEDEEDGES